MLASKTLCVFLILFVGCSSPTPPPVRAIVQVLDWHLIGQEAFSADLESQDATITDEEIESEYQQHVEHVAAIQAEQKEILLRLIEQHNATAVYLEGLTPENVEVFESMITTARNAKPGLELIEKEAALLNDDAEHNWNRSRSNTGSICCGLVRRDNFTWKASSPQCCPPNVSGNTGRLIQ